MSHPKKTAAKATPRPGVTKLPVFTAQHPRPARGVVAATDLAPGADLLPPEAGFVVDARRISAIHTRQKELVPEIADAKEALSRLCREQEELYKENLTLRDGIAVAAAPEAWQENATSHVRR